jgi:hypothetical protein
MLVLIFREKKVKTSPGTSEEDGASSTRELRIRGIASTDEEAVVDGRGELRHAVGDDVDET